jgi:hypothetical protein
VATTMVHICVDEKVKERAAKTLAAMGLSVSDAVRVLLVRVAADTSPLGSCTPHSAALRPAAGHQHHGLLIRECSDESQLAAECLHRSPQSG